MIRRNFLLLLLVALYCLCASLAFAQASVPIEVAMPEMPSFDWLALGKEFIPLIIMACAIISRFVPDSKLGMFAGMINQFAMNAGFADNDKVTNGTERPPTVQSGAG